MKQIPFISSPSELEIPPLYYVDSCNSTQDLVQDLINQEETFSKPIACFTFNQLKGKGQGKNSWNDVLNQSVAYSIAIPLLDSLDLVLLNKYLTLKVLYALQTYSTENIFIKWPNDLICLNRKLSGLLMQILSNNGGMRYIVLGIGINVNQENIQIQLPNAVSLKEIVGQSINLEELTKHLHLTLSSKIQGLKNAMVNSGIEITRIFNENLWGRKSELYLKIEDGSIINEVLGSVSGDGYSDLSQSGIDKIRVKVMGVDHHGRLQFEYMGQPHAYHHGQVKISYENE